MSDFENEPRRIQEINGRPLADKVYRSVFGEDITIQRMDNKEDVELDKRLGIDIKITLPTGHVLNGQEKILSHKYAKFESMTVEYMQNPITGEVGDWFKLAAQFYFVGYLTEDKNDFILWGLMDWVWVVIKTLDGTIHWGENGNNNSSALASFRYTNMTKLPKECVISCSWLPGDDDNTTTYQYEWKL